MKRRSFLGLLGLAPAAPVIAKLIDTIPSPAEETVTYPVSGYPAGGNQFECSGSYSATCIWSDVSVSYRPTIRYK